MITKVRELREEQHMSQEELSAKSGVSRTIISYLENNKDVDYKLSTLKAISKTLGKPISEIFLT